VPRNLWPLLAAALMLALPTAAVAIVGGIEERDPDGLRRGVVALYRGERLICSGALIAPDLVLSAAHCVAGVRPDRVVGLDARFRARAWPVVAAEAHPDFVPAARPADQKGVDLAVLRIGGTRDGFVLLALDGALSSEPESLVLAGFGLASEQARGARRLRSARGFKAVPAFGPARLFVDEATDGRRSGKSACHGDSGGPLLAPGPDGAPAVAGIVSWTSGPLDSPDAACGGLTAVVPVAAHRAWIAGAARRTAPSR